MPKHAGWFFIILSLLLLTLAAAGAQEEKGGFRYFGPSHEDVDQSKVIKPQANPQQPKKHRRLKHPRCDPDTGRCRW